MAMAHSLIEWAGFMLLIKYAPPRSLSLLLGIHHHTEHGNTSTIMAEESKDYLCLMLKLPLHASLVPPFKNLPVGLPWWHGG